MIRRGSHAETRSLIVKVNKRDVSMAVPDSRATLKSKTRRKPAGPVVVPWEGRVLVYLNQG